MNQEQFILASASPRRKELLEKAGYRFVVIPSAVDENLYTLTDKTPYQIAWQLALAKAKEVSDKFPDKWVLAADTVVDAEGKTIGKPTDRSDAQRILQRLFSKPHSVLTGVALMCAQKHFQQVDVISTTVYPRVLTQADIDVYLESGQWQGKAGAYGIQETADAFVERIDGSFTNVMGLPMEYVQTLLASVGIFPNHNNCHNSNLS